MSYEMGCQQVRFHLTVSWYYFGHNGLNQIREIEEYDGGGPSQKNAVIIQNNQDTVTAKYIHHCMRVFVWVGVDAGGRVRVLPRK